MGAAAIVAQLKKSKEVQRIIDEIFGLFIAHGTWPNAEQFDIDHHAEISLVDQLRREDFMRIVDGRLELRVSILAESVIWKKESNNANLTLRRLTALYKIDREKLWQIEDLMTGGSESLTPGQVQRSLWYLNQLGLLGGYQMSEPGQFASVRISPSCLRVNSLEEKIAADAGRERMGKFLGPHLLAPQIKAQVEPLLPGVETVFDISKLHPKIAEAARAPFQARDFREAILKAFIAVFDRIRERVGRSDDGETLITHSFSANSPLLKVNGLRTESDRNEQVGFMEMLRGAYRGIRNPKAHTLKSKSMPQQEAFEYLATASWMMRRVDSAIRVRSVKRRHRVGEPSNGVRSQTVKIVNSPSAGAARPCNP